MRHGADAASGCEQGGFHGSNEVGKVIIKQAADTLKRVTMELGGKSPTYFLTTRFRECD